MDASPGHSDKFGCLARKIDSISSKFQDLASDIATTCPEDCLKLDASTFRLNKILKELEKSFKKYFCFRFMN